MTPDETSPLARRRAIAGRDDGLRRAPARLRHRAGSRARPGRPRRRSGRPRREPAPAPAQDARGRRSHAGRTGRRARADGERPPDAIARCWAGSTSSTTSAPADSASWSAHATGCWAARWPSRCRCPSASWRPGDVDRFLREARAAARLDHPHIVRVFDAGELGPLGYFIASEFCAGPSLRRWLKAQNEPVPARLAARWMAAIADAVQHAHDRGILHRDIKPDNIILSRRRPSPDGFIPRLTDFGLAKLLEEAGDETRSDARLGTPQYMAPEQAAGPSPRGRARQPTSTPWARPSTRSWPAGRRSAARPTPRPCAWSSRPSRSPSARCGRDCRATWRRSA